MLFLAYSIKMVLEIAKESAGILLVNENHLVCTVLRNVLIKGVIKFNFNKSKTTLWRFL